jgi:hypothetical protein
MSKIELRPIERKGFCRGCDREINIGSNIIYTYSHRNRGQSILFCIDCAKHIGALATNVPEVKQHNLEKIYADLKNNDYRSLEEFLGDKFYSGEHKDTEFIGKTSVDFHFRYVEENRYDVLERAIIIAKENVKYKFGEDIEMIPVIMDELLPGKLGIELWCFTRK